MQSTLTITIPAPQPAVGVKLEYLLIESFNHFHRTTGYYTDNAVPLVHQEIVIYTIDIPTSWNKQQFYERILPDIKRITPSVGYRFHEASSRELVIGPTTPESEGTWPR